MMGECNCACMPVLNPFGRDVLFSFFAFPVCCSTVSFYFIGSSTSVFPDQHSFCLLSSFIYFCCDYGVVFVCFSFSFGYFPDLTLLLNMSFCASFICEVCFLFKTMLLCFLSLGVQMQMPNEIITTYTASVSVILFIANHY